MSIDDFINDNEWNVALYRSCITYRFSFCSSQFRSSFFLTLMKLRQNRTNYELGPMFGISKTTVDNIWITWINFLARQFRDINFWPDRETVNFFSPCDFYHKFPSQGSLLMVQRFQLKNPNSLLLNNLPFLHTKTEILLKCLLVQHLGD